MPTDAKYPCLVLVTNSWNDWGYRTLFKLFYYQDKDDRTEIGDIKILDGNLQKPEDKESVTKLKSHFFKLPSGYGSLGQSLEYYSQMKSLFPETFNQVLNSLNDVATNAGIRDKLEDHHAFRRSLLRSSEAEKALNEAQRVLAGTSKNVHNNFDFVFSVKLENATEDHRVRFVFKGPKRNPFRTIVIIGNNGTGKTKFLMHLASSLCDTEAPGYFDPTRPLFSKVIAISFSLFDEFEVPKTTKQFSYKYIGYRQADFTVDRRAIDQRLRNAFQDIKRKNREDEWTQFVERVIGIKELEAIFGVELKSDLVKEDFNLMVEKRGEMLSSGQNIVFFLISELVATLRKDSIILFDEPETHLHPNIIARMLKALNELLNYYDSFAILTTHSPIVVQETPSRNVRVFDRIGNTPVIKNLPIESFGENLSRITNAIFYRNQTKETYKEYFDEKIKGNTIDQVNDEFDGGLSTNALLYLSAINPNEKKKRAK